MKNATISKDYSGSELQYNETLKQWEIHKAIDFIPSDDVKVYAVADGTVSNVKLEDSEFYTGDDCIAGIGNLNVLVKKGAVVKNSIIMQDNYIGANTSLDCVITDKNVVINDGRMLSGHETMPFFIGKGIMV